MARLIGDFFGRSFFGPINEHMQISVRAVELLPELIETYLRGEYGEVEKLAGQMKKTEGEADQLKHNIRSLISPSPKVSATRVDLLQVINLQDAVADGCERVAILLTLRRRPVPEEVKEDFRALAAEVVKTALKLGEITAGLHSSTRGSRRASKARTLLELEQVHELEHQADNAEQELMRKLFEMEDSLEPVSIFFLSKVCAELGRIADSAENAADTLRRFVDRET